jgi:hypothetical protein
MQGLGLNAKKIKFVPSKYISTHCSRVFMKIDTDSEEPRRSIAGSILTVVELNDPGFREHRHMKYTCKLPKGKFCKSIFFIQ